MGTGIDPKVDYAFKRVFGSEENRNVLLHLIRAMIYLNHREQRIKNRGCKVGFCDNDESLRTIAFGVSSQSDSNGGRLSPVL